MIADDQNSNGSSGLPKYILEGNPQIPKKWRYFWNTIQKIGDNFGIRALLHRNGKAEGEAVGVDRFGDYLRMNLDVRSEMERK